jgi:hypothetical protein
MMPIGLRSDADGFFSDPAGAAPTGMASNSGVLHHARKRDGTLDNTDFADTCTRCMTWPRFETTSGISSAVHYKRYLICEPLALSRRGWLLGWHLWAHLSPAWQPRR